MIRVRTIENSHAYSGDSFRRGIFAMISTICKDASKRLSFLFWLTALHSFFVGWFLILHPSGLIHMFGFYSINETFFPVQGGVFHVLMSIFYLYAALRLEGFKSLVFLCSIIKFGAFVFLVSYYFFVRSIFIVLVSGLIDGFMAAAMIGVLLSYKKQESARYSREKTEGRNDQ